MNFVFVLVSYSAVREAALFSCLFIYCAHNSSGWIRPHSGGLISDKAHGFVADDMGYTLLLHPKPQLAGIDPCRVLGEGLRNS